MKNKDIVICYDLCSLPNNSSVEEIFHIMELSNMLFYQSINPYSLNINKPPYALNGKITKKLIDVSNYDNIKLLDEQLKKLNNEQI